MTVQELIDFLVDYPNKLDDVCIYNYKTCSRDVVVQQAFDSGVSGCLDIGYDEDAI